MRHSCIFAFCQCCCCCCCSFVAFWIAIPRAAFTYLRTTTLCVVAAATSMLSTPAPARPTTFRLPAPAASTSAVIFVSERTMAASKFCSEDYVKQVVSGYEKCICHMSTRDACTQVSIRLFIYPPLEREEFLKNSTII